MATSDSTNELLVFPASLYPKSPPRASWTLFGIPVTVRRILLFLTGSVAFIVVLLTVYRRPWRPKALDPLELEPFNLSGHPPPPSKPPDACASPEPVDPARAEELALQRLEAMVNITKGYYVRDYSLWLGWNNMRYILEASVLQADLLNRTLVIPSFVYARHCEVGIDVCAAFAEMVNRGDAMGSDQWRNLPWEQQLGWKIPIHMMLDLEHLRKTHSVVTLQEYLRLHGLPPDRERGNGQWSDEDYSTRSRKIKNSWWDPPGVIRVDRRRNPLNATDGDNLNPEKQLLSVRVQSVLNAMMEANRPNLNALQHNVLDWEPVRGDLQAENLDVDDDEHMAYLLRAAGFEVLHTWKGSRGQEFIKSVAIPVKQVARASDIRGTVDDYGAWPDRVVYLEGEVHDNRKPGFLRFTSLPEAQKFARTVLYDFRAPLQVEEVAERVAKRMRGRTQGRLWRAAHLRRGDFMNMGWSSWSFERDMQIAKEKLNRAPQIWRDIRSGSARTFDIPDGRLNPATYEAELPQEDDPFYVATDERDPHTLDYIRSQGGVLIMDLLEPEDRRLMGWPVVVTDVMAILEQHVMARAAYFVGNGLSSVTGGVMNLRAINGWDPRTTEVE